MSWKIHQGDALAVLRTMPDEHVQCVATSPPYWGLRDYGTATWEGGDAACDHTTTRRGHGDEKQATSAGTSRDSLAGMTECRACGARRIDSQMGLEPTPEAYIARMVEVFREVRRVLRKDGTLWLNMGDCYASGSSGHDDGNGTSTLVGSRPHGRKREQVGGLKPKDLVMMPARLALALQADGWWLRSDIVWAKPNPMPESVTDRPTKSHEYVFLLSKSARYYYDAEAIRERALSAGDVTWPAGWGSGDEPRSAVEFSAVVGRSGNKARKPASARGVPVDTDGSTNGAVPGSVPWEGNARNARTVWTIATSPFPEAHFATFPPELARRCIAAGTSERGACPECGAPWERVVDRELVATRGKVGAHNGDGPRHDPSGTDAGTAWNHSGGVYGRYQTETLAWKPGCAHQADPAPCRVLDPFAGAGTTLLVADRMQRDAEGIELNAKYVEMARRRIVADAPLLSSEAG